MDPNYLEQLRANAEAVRADLEERIGVITTPIDPQEAHEEIMAATRPTLPAIVHKTHEGNAGRAAFSDDSNGDAELPPIFNEEQTEALADALADILAEMRAEMQDAIDAAVAPLRERIAVLEGKLDMLVSLISNGDKSFTASETVRKLQVTR